MSYDQRAYAILPATAILVGIGLRAWTLGDSLWLDELHTAWCVVDDWSEVARRARLGNNSPLFFYLVYPITSLFGLTEWNLRLISLLAGVAVIPATYWLARSWRCGVAASCLAASLVAVDPNFLFYAREARVYALVQLVSVIHIYCFTRLVEDATLSRRVSWVFSGCLLFHLHYTTVLLLASEIVGYAVLSLFRRASNENLPIPKPRTLSLSSSEWERGLAAGKFSSAARLNKGTRYRASQLAVDTAALILACSAAFGHLQQIAQRKANWGLFVHSQPLGAIVSLFPLHTYILLPLVFVAAARLVTRKAADRGEGTEPRSAESFYFIIALVWLFVPLTLAWVLTQTDLARLFFRRYVIASSVAPAMFTALIVHQLSKPWAPMMSTIVLLVGWLALSERGWQGERPILKHSHEDWRGAVAYVNSDSHTLPVFIRSGLIEADEWHASNIEALREFCVMPVRGLYQLESRFREVVPLPTSLEQSISASDVARVTRQGGVYLLLRGTPEVQNAVVDQFLAVLRETNSAARVASRQAFGRVAVARIAVPQQVGKRQDN